MKLGYSKEDGDISVRKSASSPSKVPSKSETQGYVMPVRESLHGLETGCCANRDLTIHQLLTFYSIPRIICPRPTFS